MVLENLTFSFKVVHYKKGEMHNYIKSNKDS
jgi:hypothetical protein